MATRKNLTGADYWREKAEQLEKDLADANYLLDNFKFVCEVNQKTIKELKHKCAALSSTAPEKPKKKAVPNPLGFQIIDGGKGQEQGPFAPVSPS